MMPKPPARLTVAASLPSATTSIGASRIGCCTLSSSVRRVEIGIVFSQMDQDTPKYDALIAGAAGSYLPLKGEVTREARRVGVVFLLNTVG